MKKTLLGTTALAVVGILASSPAGAEERIKLGLGGFMTNWFSAGSHDSDQGTDFGATGLFSEGEIIFEGETTLDNGISFGAQVQLESFGASPRGGDRDVIDEDFVYIEGSFGRINIGSENSAAYLMHYKAPVVGVPLVSGRLAQFVPPDGARSGNGFRTPRLSTNLDFGNDENIITYFTPRLSGFQLGASYAPAVVGSGDGANLPVQADKDTEFHNGISFGVNFVESFDGLGVAVSAGYRRAEAPDTPGEGGNRPGKDTDLQQISFGTSIGYAGVTLGGSYAWENSGRATDGEAFDVGIKYATGPWAFGLTYFNGEVFGSEASGEDEVRAFEAGTSYALGPGITATASVLYIDWEGDTGLDSDGVQGVVGIVYNF